MWIDRDDVDIIAMTTCVRVCVCMHVTDAIARADSLVWPCDKKHIITAIVIVISFSSSAKTYAYVLIR